MAVQGIEPRERGKEPRMLPLHHTAIRLRVSLACMLTKHIGFPTLSGNGIWQTVRTYSTVIVQLCCAVAVVLPVAELFVFVATTL